MKYLTPIDLAQNEIQNAVWQNLAADPGTPAVGQFWLNTTSQRPKIRINGSTLDLSEAVTLGGQSSAFHLGRANHTGTQLSTTISDFNTAVRTNRIDQLASAGADVVMGGFKLTGLANGSALGDAVTFQQLQSVQNGTVWKDRVAVATTANITLSGEQTIDGVATLASRVLVKNQSAASQNGFYLSSAGAWSRTADVATGANAANVTAFVEQGATQADTQWSCSSNTGAAVAGTHSLAFVQIGSGTSYSADGTTLTLTGAVFSINAAYAGQTSIVTVGVITSGVWGGTAIAVNKGGTNATTAVGARINLGATGKYSAIIGDGSATSISIAQATHGLATDGTNCVALYDATTGAQVFTNVTVAPGSGSVTLSFSVAPTVGQYRVVIIG
jgi:hypothetical protein